MTDVKEQARYAARVQAYRIVSRAYFHLPVVVVFLIQQGFGPLATAALLALYGVTAALGDHVVAPLRRRLSLAGCLVAGEAVKLAGLLILLAPVSTGVAVASQVLAGLGFCLTAGTDAALASTLLSGERFRTREARTQAGMFLISFAAGVLGALAYAQYDRAPFVLSALGCAVAALVVLPGGRGGLRPQTAEPGAGGTAVTGPGRVLPWQVRLWASYYSVSRAVLLTAYTFLLPLLLFFGEQLSVTMFGAVLGLYTLCGLMSVRLSLAWQRRYSATTLFWLSSGAMVLGLLLLAPGGLLAIAGGTALLGLAGGTVRPTTMGFLGPAMAGLSDAERQRVTRGLERRQGIVQAALLIGAGLWLGSGGSATEAVAACAVLVVAGQAVAARLVARQAATKPDGGPEDRTSTRSGAPPVSAT
ncbi:hypothetical protein ABT024_12610 [Streptomyces sp. NPDC002812]|uniref:hypothetical protein n=1 Tax=unclassified Streptomyces TaxID=2593676 RepID=UPI00202E4544|nr:MULTISPECIES: hypothetical protein [unclassified Streptomyces]MCM1974720.1 hypothetical protein [Streptomyces sp. G1]MCX5123759.1 hypothetical protein [Streptomyces sp. NBC_00347]MCX5297006.1 hypothetical protein [Streptomyces sp. NBC_00193]